MDKVSKLAILKTVNNSNLNSTSNTTTNQHNSRRFIETLQAIKDELYSFGKIFPPLKHRDYAIILYGYLSKSQETWIVSLQQLITDLRDDIIPINKGEPEVDIYMRLQQIYYLLHNSYINHYAGVHNSLIYLLAQLRSCLAHVLSLLMKNVKTEKYYAHLLWTCQFCSY